MYFNYADIPIRNYSSFNTDTLTHVTNKGEATMVDVTDKIKSTRYASASGEVYVGDRILKLIKENELKKGDALTVAKLAGIMGAKKTPEVIPLCHNVLLSYVNVTLAIDDDNKCIKINSQVRCHGETGVEMEALTAVGVAALTLYDMCKAVSHDIVIKDIRLVEKSGGKRDFKR